MDCGDAPPPRILCGRDEPHRRGWHRARNRHGLYGRPATGRDCVGTRSEARVSVFKTETPPPFKEGQALFIDLQGLMVLSRLGIANEELRFGRLDGDDHRPSADGASSRTPRPVLRRRSVRSVTPSA
jgi:hypothetical protein